MKYNEAVWSIFAGFLLTFISVYILVPGSFGNFKMVFNNNAYAEVLSSLSPQAELIINHNQKFHMSTFILGGGGKFNKVGFPALPDSDTHLNLQEGSPISFQFSQKPLKVEAFIVDYDGDIPSVLPLKKIGSNSFEIASLPGIWNIEVHATFPGDQYSSFTALANVLGSPKSLSINSIGQETACSNASNLTIQGVTDNNNSIDSLAVAQSFNSNNSAHNVTAWSSTGKGSWIQFDLGKELSVCKLLVGFANGDKIIDSFSIQTSADGMHFVNEGTVQNTGMVSGGELFNIPNSPVQARYVKITFQSNTQGEISNFKVIGTGNIPNVENSGIAIGTNANGVNGGNEGNGGSANGGNKGVGGIGGNGGNDNGVNGMNANGANGANGTNANGVNGMNANGGNGGVGGIGGNGGNGGNANGGNGGNGGNANGGNGGNGGSAAGGSEGD
jgi:hypothetical protein